MPDTIYRLNKLVLVTAPTVEPVSTADMRTHLRITQTADNDYIDTLVKAAREACEEYQFRRLINSTWDWKLDSFPGVTGELCVPYPPLSSVTSITYTDTAGDSQTFSSGDYTVDTTSEPGRIVPAYGDVWPTPRSHINVVTVRYVAGYGSAATSLPAATVHGIKKLAAFWYERRDLFGTIPDEVYRIWDTHRLARLF